MKTHYFGMQSVLLKNGKGDLIKHINFQVGFMRYMI